MQAIHTYAEALNSEQVAKNSDLTCQTEGEKSEIWILTRGTDCGTARYVGKALGSNTGAHRRGHYLPGGPNTSGYRLGHYLPGYRHDLSEQIPVRCIGIAPWGYVEDPDSIPKENDRVSYQHCTFGYKKGYRDGRTQRDYLLVGHLKNLL